MSKAVYMIGGNLEGRKEVLALTISEGENFWLQLLADLAIRGCRDILRLC